MEERPEINAEKMAGIRKKEKVFAVKAVLVLQCIAALVWVHTHDWDSKPSVPSVNAGVGDIVSFDFACIAGDVETSVGGVMFVYSGNKNTYRARIVADFYLDPADKSAINFYFPLGVTILESACSYPDEVSFQEKTYFDSAAKPIGHRFAYANSFHFLDSEIFRSVIMIGKSGFGIGPIEGGGGNGTVWIDIEIDKKIMKNGIASFMLAFGSGSSGVETDWGWVYFKEGAVPTKEGLTNEINARIVFVEARCEKWIVSNKERYDLGQANIAALKELLAELDGIGAEDSSALGVAYNTFAEIGSSPIINLKCRVAVRSLILIYSRPATLLM